MAPIILRLEDKLDGESNFLSWKERVTFIFEGIWLLGDCGQSSSFIDISTGFNSSPQEGDQNPMGNIECNEGSYNSSFIWEEYGQGEVWCPRRIILDR